MKSFRQHLQEYSLNPNYPDFGKPKDPPPPSGDDEIRATIHTSPTLSPDGDEVHIASSYHPIGMGLTVRSANIAGTYMFGVSHGKTLLHSVIMDDGRVKHVHQINPATGDHFIPESDIEKVESLVVRHLSAHVHDSDGYPTGRSVHEHHTSPEG